MTRSTDNPFRAAPGSEPPALVGRDEELGVAHYSLGLTRAGAAAQPVIFTGLRGMGKTVLLRRSAVDARSQGGIVVYAEASRDEPLSVSLRRGLERAKKDVASLPERLKKTIDAVVGALPRTSLSLPNEMGAVELSAKAAPERAFADVLEDLNDAVRHHGRFLVFAIDELQEAPIADLRDLVRFIHDTAGTNEPAFFMGAGLPNTPEHLHHVRTYTERWRYLRIGLLSREETMEAISRPARERKIAIDDSALERLAQESAGYPFFIQEYASAAWLQHTGARIAAKDVEAVVHGVRRFLEDEFYDARFRKLTPRECLYAIAMADLGPGPHTVGEIAERLGADSRDVSSIRNQLIKKDVAYSPSSGMLEFRIPLTERYVAQHREELARRASDVSMKKR